MGITISLPVLTAEQRERLLSEYEPLHNEREAELKRVDAEATERGGEESSVRSPKLDEVESRMRDRLKSLLDGNVVSSRSPIAIFLGLAVLFTVLHIPVASDQTRGPVLQR